MFYNLIKARKQQKRDVYLEFVSKMHAKQENYERIFVDTGKKQKKLCYFSKKTGKMLYLEKYRIFPGHEGGKYTQENILLLTFEEHVMAHYLRFLQYGKREDYTAVSIMLSNSNEEMRRLFSSFAGSIGGKTQQELLREQNRGWYNSSIQSQLGKKGSEQARQHGVGAFDFKNKIKADIAWQEKYQTDLFFQDKMKKNLLTGLETQRKQGKNIYNSLSQRIRSLNYHGILISMKEKNTRFATPYSSYSIETGKFEYTEARVHVSEDFFWYYVLLKK